MHDCKADVELTVKVRIQGVRAQFNGNYKGGNEVMEDAGVEEFLSVIPTAWGVEVLDVNVENYEHTQAEREVEHED